MKTAAKPISTDVKTASAFDVEKVRADFPILQRTVHGKPLVYLDSAATAQRPEQVIDAVTAFYRAHNANVHRGVHLLSQEATQAFEQARLTMQRYLGAADVREIIFTRGTTESINLVAQSWGRANLAAGDEILITHMEHHSNIVPWQLLCEQTGAVLKVAPITDRGELDMSAFESLLSDRTKIVAAVHQSNALGTINPVKRIAELAHARGAIVLFDGAQAAAHHPLDVREIGCDFYAISGHKMYGPTGIGALYGRRDLLEAMPPWQGGGEMIKSVTFEKTIYHDLPHKFEAGTPNIAGAIGMGAAAAYIQALDADALAAHEHDLLEYGSVVLRDIPGLRMIGTAEQRASVLSFVLGDVHPHDIGTILDQEGIAIRTGHHCAQPVMERFGVPATARASIGMYNTRAEFDALAAGLRRAVEVFA